MGRFTNHNFLVSSAILYAHYWLKAMFVCFILHCMDEIGGLQCNKCFCPDFSEFGSNEVDQLSVQTGLLQVLQMYSMYMQYTHAFSCWRKTFFVCTCSKEKEQPLTKWHSARFEGFWSGKEGSCRPAEYQAEAISPRSTSCYGTCIKNPVTSAFLMFT